MHLGLEIWCFATSRLSPEIVCHLMSVTQVVETDGVDRAESLCVVARVEVAVYGIRASHQK